MVEEIRGLGTVLEPEPLGKREVLENGEVQELRRWSGVALQSDVTARQGRRRLFEDQSRSNPVGDEDDPPGSLLDGLMLSEYVRLAATRYIGGRDAPLTFMAACGHDRLLVLGPQVPQPASGSLTPEELADFARRSLAGVTA